MSDYPEDHTKKGKRAGITKIEGSGIKEGGEGTEKTMVAAFILATYLEILKFMGKKKKKIGGTTMRTFWSFRNLARE